MEYSACVASRRLALPQNFIVRVLSMFRESLKSAVVAGYHGSNQRRWKEEHPKIRIRAVIAVGYGRGARFYSPWIRRANWAANVL